MDKSLTRFTCEFTGKRTGALGTSSRFHLDVYSVDTEAALLKIYDLGYEHLTQVNIRKATD